MGCDTPVEVKRHFGELSSFSPSCGSQVLNAGHQPWWEVPLPAESSLNFSHTFSKIRLFLCS